MNFFKSRFSYLNFFSFIFNIWIVYVIRFEGTTQIIISHLLFIVLVTWTPV